MAMTAFLLALKLLTVYVDPENSLSRDDQTLATCIVSALTERPSGLVLAKAKEGADVVLTVGNHAGKRLHVIGTLTKADGTAIIAINHVQHGLNHSLCNQANGLLDEMVTKASKK